MILVYYLKTNVVYLQKEKIYADHQRQINL